MVAMLRTEICNQISNINDKIDVVFYCIVQVTMKSN